MHAALPMHASTHTPTQVLRIVANTLMKCNPNRLYIPSKFLEKEKMESFSVGSAVFEVGGNPVSGPRCYSSLPIKWFRRITTTITVPEEPCCWVLPRKEVGV